MVLYRLLAGFSGGSFKALKLVRLPVLSHPAVPREERNPIDGPSAPVSG